MKRKMIPVRIVTFKELKPERDEVIEVSPPQAFFIFQPENKQPGGYYGTSHHVHYYKVDGFEYDKALKGALR